MARARNPWLDVNSVDLASIATFISVHYGSQQAPELGVAC
jgi:hypothetical protein